MGLSDWACLGGKNTINITRRQFTAFLAPYWMRAPVLISSELKKKLLKIKLHAGDVGQLIECLSSMQRTPSLVPSNMQTMPALL